MWCDQSKYIQHCLRESGFYDKDGRAPEIKGGRPKSTLVGACPWCAEIKQLHEILEKLWILAGLGD